jgi:hypothetical protein
VHQLRPERSAGRAAYLHFYYVRHVLLFFCSILFTLAARVRAHISDHATLGPLVKTFGARASPFFVGARVQPKGDVATSTRHACAGVLARIPRERSSWSVRDTTAMARRSSLWLSKTGVGTVPRATRRGFSSIRSSAASSVPTPGASTDSTNAARLCTRVCRSTRRQSRKAWCRPKSLPRSSVCSARRSHWKAVGGFAMLRSCH